MNGELGRIRDLVGGRADARRGLEPLFWDPLGSCDCLEKTGGRISTKVVRVKDVQILTHVFDFDVFLRFMCAKLNTKIRNRKIVHLKSSKLYPPELCCLLFVVCIFFGSGIQTLSCHF